MNIELFYLAKFYFSRPKCQEHRQSKTHNKITESSLFEMIKYNREDSEMSEAQKKEQANILYEFLKYAKMAEHLFYVTQASNWDTANINDPSNIFQKNELLKRARKTIISSVDDILKNSFVDKVKEAMLNTRNAFSEILISDKENARNVIENVTLPYISLPQRDFAKLYQKAVFDMFDWAMQNSTKLNEKIIGILLGKENRESAAKQIIEYRDKIIGNKAKNIEGQPEHPLYNNFILRNIELRSGNRVGDINNLAIVARDNKVYDQDLIIYGFEELRKGLKAEGNNKLYSKLLALSVLQSGLSASPISFTSLLPYEDFVTIYNESLSSLNQIDNLSDFQTLHVFERNNWNNDNIIDFVRAMMKMVSDPYSEYGESYKDLNTFLDRKLTNAIRNKSIPKIIKLASKSQQAKSEFIVYTWQTNISKAESIRRRKNGDRSHIHKLLMQRVKNNDGTPYTYVETFTIDKGKSTERPINVERYLYKAINAWGDSYRGQELYGAIEPTATLGKQSVLNNGFDKVNEVGDEVILDIIEGKKKEEKSSIVEPTIKAREYTPENITSLKPNEIFVFGSNTEGRHGAGAALVAKEKFGAIQGNPKGMQGQSYAIITKDLSKGKKSIPLSKIKDSLWWLMREAESNKDKKFFVTKLGSSLAGYSIDEIRNLFKELSNEISIPDNIILPKEYEVRDQISPEKETGGYYQVKEVPASRASAATVAAIKKAMEKMGINLTSLEEYARKNPDVNVRGINGLADLVQKVVAIAHDMEDVAITEETVHIATAMIEQVNPRVVTEMISKIDRFKIYKNVLEKYKTRKDYQTKDGKPDIRKIKKEAVDKLIAEVIINRSENTTEFPELLEETNKSWVEKIWNAVKDLIRGMYRRSNIDIFEQVASKIKEGEVENIEIEKGGVFAQVKNDLVDAYYNTVKSWAARLNVVEEDVEKGTPRYYTLDGEGKIPTVTQRVKSKQKFGGRTESQKIADEMKREWGTEGHSYIQNYIVTNLIDKDGYVREKFGTVAIDSPLGSEITDKLQEFAQKLVRSFRPGTRILIEERIINTRVKGMLASTFDFKAIEPTEDGKDIKIHTLDWKFVGIDKSREEDIPFFKQKEWIPQMGEYTRIDYNYGAKPNQIGMARMIPFQLNYQYKIPGDSKSGLYPASIEIGDLDPNKEPNLYLLPVPTEAESSGSKEVDALVKSLTTHYEKLINKRVSPEEKLAKRVRLAEFSKAIRLLRMKMDFLPLYEVAKSFMEDANISFKSFENIDYTKLTQDDIKEKLKKLLELQASAEKFATIDDTFLSVYPKESLTKEQGEVLVKLERVTGATSRLMRKINEFQNEFAVQYALKEGYTTEATKENILQPQKEVTGLARTLMELSRLPNRIINIVSNAILNARSYTDLKIKEKIDEYTQLLLPLENLAKSQGKAAFDYIGKVVNGELRLIEKIDKNFWEELERNKVARNKQFLIDNLNMEEYNKVAKETIDRISDEIRRTYSSDERSVVERRDFELKKLENALNIESKEFDGYTDKRFAYVFSRTMRADKHYSEDFKRLMNVKEAYDVWKFFTALNERGIKNGYLSHRKISFFALIEATMLQKLAASDNLLREAGNIATDLYTVKINEEQIYSKIDKETGELRREIPRLFTKTDKDVHQLSRDLTKVGVLWIRSLMEYEMAERMKDTLLTLEHVERSKGHIMVDESGEPIREGGQLMIDLKSNKSADIIKTVVDDFIYGLHEDMSSIGTSSITAITEKVVGDSKRAQEKSASIRKGLENMNMLTQALAVGLKLTVAIPNYFGNHFQSYINNGGMYKYREFFKNHLKMITNINLSTIEKGILDMIVPLNGDIAVEEHRKLASKQGFIKWLGAWNIQEFMMSTNYLPERNLQFTNALSHIDNAMVVDGKIVNIRQYLKAKERDKYSKMTYQERRQFEKGLDKRVEDLKASSSLAKIAKIENDRVVIPGVSDEEIAKFRTKIVEWGRNLNGQMSQENKAGYRRDVLLKSFAMFRNWIPKQVTVRAHDIQKNLETGDWEYGRTRAFIKAYIQACHWSIGRMIDIMHGTEKGLAILDEMLQQKKDDYFRKNGVELEITTEEFYDMMRTALSNEMKELGTLLSLVTIVLAAKAATPPDDDGTNKNTYKYVMRLINKSADEVRFYYSPLSFLSMTRGSFLPALGTIGKVQRALTQLGKETYGYMTDDEEMMKKAYPLKYFIDIIPVGSQFEREILPLIAPDVAKEMGIRVVAQPRIQQ